MFAELLTTDEQHALVKLMGLISQADGELTSAERAFLEDYAAKLSIAAEEDLEALAGVDIAALAPALARPKARRIAIAELISMALSDGAIHDEELNGLYAIGGALGVSMAEVTSLLCWVLAGVEWRAKGEQLLGLAEVPGAAAENAAPLR